ncbi:MAG TPA: tetratricopeptide repeat protein [Anaeromyxobacteraceae bacterium]|nr:tetratricopeptide repeat protein [Anaeromyxobacteraceae bacterium]
MALSESDPAGAAALFERAFRIDNSLAAAAYDAGVLHERLGEVDRARDAYGRALAAVPDFEAASLNLTRLRLRAGQAEEAEADLRARAAAHPEAVGLRNQLVEVLLATGRLDAAEQEARRILKSDEHDIRAMVNLATAYSLEGRQELARMVLENARQIAPGDPVVWNRLGMVELQLGARAQALEHFRKAAELGESYPEGHVNYGAMLVEAEAFADAVKHLELAVKHAPGSSAAHLNLGNAYRGAKAFEKAEQAYQRALEIDPGLGDAWFDLGLLYLDGEKPGLPTAARLERAIALLDRYAAAGGADPKLSQYRRDASVQLDKERRRLAREERDRLRAPSPENR